VRADLTQPFDLIIPRLQLYPASRLSLSSLPGIAIGLCGFARLASHLLPTELALTRKEISQYMVDDRGDSKTGHCNSQDSHTIDEP
jgi:hypothetical protein